MINLFDISTGKITFTNDMVLQLDMTHDQCVGKGFVIRNEIDVRTGWVYKSTETVRSLGESIMLSLGFYLKQLKTVSISLVENYVDSNLSLFERHNIFLRGQLGEPDEQNARQIIYRYSWGEVASEIDPRGDGVYISVRWISDV